MKALDLFSGRRTALAAFECEKDYVEITDGVDIMEWEPYHHYDFIWASPPCNCFSVASIYRHWDKDGKPNPETVEAMKLVFRALWIIDAAMPRYWILENPRGMLRRILGYPQVTTFWGNWGMPYCKPTDLWGKLPPMDYRTVQPKGNAPRGSHEKGLQGLTSGKTPLDRAAIPYEFSKVLWDALVKI